MATQLSHAQLQENRHGKMVIATSDSKAMTNKLAEMQVADQLYRQYRCQVSPLANSEGCHQSFKQFSKEACEARKV